MMVCNNIKANENYGGLIHKKHYSTLVFIAFISVMLSRLMVALGAPSSVNFIHFGLIFILFMLNIIKDRYKTHPSLLAGLFFFLISISLSALFNGTGMGNILFEFLLFSEPFLLLYLLLDSKWTPFQFKSFSTIIYAILVLHVCIAYYQGIILQLGNDDIVGLFLGMGAGAHIAGAISFIMIIYLLGKINKNLAATTFAIFALANVIILSDTKQVIITGFFSLIFLFVLRKAPYRTKSKWMIVIIIAILGLITLANTLIPSLRHWSNINILVSGLSQKFSVFSHLISYYKSPINWLVGLGPGNTVSRLAWLLPEYEIPLSPFGITYSDITNKIWQINQNNIYSNSVTGSSVFSLFFSWSGIWGDLGFLGLVSYAGIWFVIWKKFQFSKISQFLILNTLIFGSLFVWLEEPQYILFVIFIIGMIYQKSLLDFNHENTCHP